MKNGRRVTCRDQPKKCRKARAKRVKGAGRQGKRGKEPTTKNEMGKKNDRQSRLYRAREQWK